jgi:endonuclease III related protein
MFGCRPSRTATKPTLSSAKRRLGRLSEVASAHFGPLHWWPGDTPFEICVGAILTQNTAWTNVEKAIVNLKARRFLSLTAMHGADRDLLAAAIRPAGYYNQKTIKLKAFCAHVVRRHGTLRRWFDLSLGELRAELLAIHGIGPETADSILCYAAEKPIFVVDAYTRRILFRMGLTPEDATYDELQSLFHRCFPADTDVYNELHAQLVRLGNNFCRKTRPRCDSCPLALRCAN